MQSVDDRTSEVGCLIAAARHQGAGVNVERPEAEPRTYDVDAGDGWRTLAGRARRVRVDTL